MKKIHKKVMALLLAALMITSVMDTHVQAESSTEANNISVVNDGTGDAEEVSDVEKKDKKELIRVIKTPEGDITVDFTGKKNGRGAYICNSVECLKKAVKKKSLERSLKTQIPKEIYQELEKEMMKGES